MTAAGAVQAGGLLLFVCALLFVGHYVILAAAANKTATAESNDTQHLTSSRNNQNCTIDASTPKIAVNEIDLRREIVERVATDLRLAELHSQQQQQHQHTNKQQQQQVFKKQFMLVCELMQNTSRLVIDLRPNGDFALDDFNKLVKNSNLITAFSNENFTDDQQLVVLFNSTSSLLAFKESRFYYWHRLQTISSAAIFIAIVVGNVSILYKLHTNRQMRKSNVNFFIANLAIADLLVALSVAHDSIELINNGFVRGVFLCKATKFVSTLLSYASSYLLVALSVDRWEAVIRPLAFTQRKSHGLYLVLGSWLIAGVFATPSAFIVTFKRVVGPQKHCWMEMSETGWQIYTCYLAVTLVVAPSIVILICYVWIVRTIRRKDRVASSQNVGKASAATTANVATTTAGNIHWRLGGLKESAPRMSRLLLRRVAAKTSGGRGGKKEATATCRNNNNSADTLEAAERPIGALIPLMKSKDRQQQQAAGAAVLGTSDSHVATSGGLALLSYNDKASEGEDIISRSSAEAARLLNVVVATNACVENNNNNCRKEKKKKLQEQKLFALPQLEHSPHCPPDTAKTTTTNQPQQQTTANSNNTTQSQPQIYQHGAGVIPRARIKTIKMTFVIVSAFVLCWSPFYIINLLTVFNLLERGAKTTVALGTLSQTLAYLNSAVNPIIFWMFSGSPSSSSSVAAKIAQKSGTSNKTRVDTAVARHRFANKLLTNQASCNSSAAGTQSSCVDWLTKAPPRPPVNTKSASRLGRLLAFVCCKQVSTTDNKRATLNCRINMTTAVISSSAETTKTEF